MSGKLSMKDWIDKNVGKGSPKRVEAIKRALASDGRRVVVNHARRPYGSKAPDIGANFDDQKNLEI